MTHEMNLRPGPFAAIASGQKVYELRLLDEKRKAIRTGDCILFRRTTDQQQMMTRVVSLHPFADFRALYAAMPMDQCGYRREDAPTADPADMAAYYPPEEQARYGVVAIGIELIRLPWQQLAGDYAVRPLGVEDVNEMLRLAASNPLYYECMHTRADVEGLLTSLQALPPGTTPEDKTFLGWFEKGQLVAFMDLVLRYPRTDVAFIGWFMVDAAKQRRGLGSVLVQDVLRLLQSIGMSEVRLGRVRGNPQSEGFWRANGFTENGASYDTDGYTVILMSRKLG